MIVLRIWEGILSIVEILGIFYILLCFQRRGEPGNGNLVCCSFL